MGRLWRLQRLWVPSFLFCFVGRLVVNIGLYCCRDGVSASHMPADQGYRVALLGALLFVSC